MINEKKIWTLTEQALADTDRFAVEISVKPGNKIFVFIDSDSAVSISHCVELSRYIESNLDRETEDFELNVSSAGLDLPYKLTRQYIKNIGRPVAVVLADGKKITGTLVAADDEGFNVTETKKIKKENIETQHRFQYSDIKETKEVIKFDN